MSKIISARVISAKNTLTNWNLSTEIPIQGELCIEIGNPMLSKIGDGINLYSALPYQTSGGASAADGTFLGIAVAATNPGVISADSFYYSQVPGNYTHFASVGTPGYIVMPSGDSLGIISYKTSTGLWTYRTLVNATVSTISNLEAVTSAGNTTDAGIRVISGALLSIESILSGGFQNILQLLNNGLDFFQTISSVTKNIQLLFTTLTANRTQTFQDASGTIALTDPRVQSQSSSSVSYTLNSDHYDWGVLTAQTSGAFTVNNPSGTPFDRRIIAYTITDNGGVINFTWGSKFYGGATTPLPVSSLGTSKPLILEFVYMNEYSGGTPWHLVGINQE